MNNSGPILGFRVYKPVTGLDKNQVWVCTLETQRSNWASHSAQTQVLLFLRRSSTRGSVPQLRPCPSVLMPRFHIFTESSQVRKVFEFIASWTKWPLQCLSALKFHSFSISVLQVTNAKAQRYTVFVQQIQLVNIPAERGLRALCKDCMFPGPQTRKEPSIHRTDIGILSENTVLYKQYCKSWQFVQETTDNKITNLCRTETGF